MDTIKASLGKHVGLFVLALALAIGLSTSMALAQPVAKSSKTAADGEALTVQIGTESTIQTGPECHVPFDMYYNNSVAEIVYPANLIVDSNGEMIESGTIKSISFYSDNSYTNTCSNLSIYLGYTAATDATSSITPSDSALVYQGSDVDINTAEGWQTFEFNQGDGTFALDSAKGNLVVVILRSGKYKIPAGWQVSFAQNASRYCASDSVSYTNLAGGIAATSGIHNYRPNTQFSIIPAPGPKFTTQPQGFTYQVGSENVTPLTAVAHSKDASFSYQWYKSDSADLKPDGLATATAVGPQGTATVSDGSATITYTPTAADLGTAAGTAFFYCAATDSAGTSLSKPAAVDIYTALAQPPTGTPIIESNPAASDGAVRVNALTTITLSASGAQPAQDGDVLHYQWFVKTDDAADFVAIEGATEATCGVKAELDKTNAYRYEVWASHEVPTNLSTHVTSSELAVTGKPVTIGSEAELRAFADAVNSGNSYEGLTASLTNDVTLTTAWTPIGTSAKPFKGTFNGDGHAISGLSIESTENYQGLFGYVDSATIVSLVVSGTGVHGKSYVAGMVGYADGTTTIQNAGNKVPVISTEGRTGGIVGEASKAVQIIACYNKASVSTSSTSARTGGIVGYGALQTTVTSCYNMGAITCTATSNNWGIGGISGGGTTLKNNINTGLVTDTSYYHGAITGEGGTFATGEDVNYYLSESSDKISSNSSATAIELTAGQLSGIENYNDLPLLLTLNVGAYEDTWIAGDDQSCPKLFWETPPGAPIITTQPISNEYTANDTIGTLICEAEYPKGSGSDDGLTYEWFTTSDKQTVLSTGKAFTPTVAAGSRETFVCIVTNPNSGDPVSVTSKSATIKVLGDYAAETPVFSTPAATTIEGKLFNDTRLETAVSVSKGDLTYQWFACEDAQGSNPQAISESTATSYKFMPSAEGTYHFFCKATNTDTFARAGEQIAEADSPVFTVKVGKYTISSPAELKAFQETVASHHTFAGEKVYLKADLDLQSDGSTQEWESIGHFEGTFDGEGHTIDGLRVNSEEAAQGLFRTLRGNAVVKNLIIGENSSVQGPYQVGGIAGNVMSGNVQIINCGNNATITAKALDAYDNTCFVGGIVGYAMDNVTITTCYNKGTINGKANCVGGIVGGVSNNVSDRYKTIITSCYNAGTVTNQKPTCATGGICGQYGKIVNCVNVGDIPGSEATDENLTGAIGGLRPKAVSAADNDASYYLDTSCVNPVGCNEEAPEGTVNHEAAYFIPKSAAKLAAPDMVEMLNVGDYAGAWIVGSNLRTPQNYPALFWEDAISPEEQAIDDALENLAEAIAAAKAIDTSGLTPEQEATLKAAIAAAESAAGASGASAADIRQAIADINKATQDAKDAIAAVKNTSKNEDPKKEEGSGNEASKKKVASVTVNVKTINAKAVAKTIKKAGGVASTITKIKLGNKCKTVSAKAFSKCTALKTLVVGKNVTKLKAKAFYGCKKLTTVTVKSKKLSKKAVKGCFKGCKAKTVKLKVPKAKKKAYKKIFTKKNCGKKVKIS